MLKNNSLNFTPVSNVFIEKYMPKARGEFIKVYLLMLKYNNSGEMGASSSILASSLNLLESDILNALNYWNDEGVLKLIPIDKMGNYNIEFVNLVEDSNPKNKEVHLLEALNKLEMVIDLDPEFALGYYHLGYHYYNQGQYVKSKVIWEEALKLGLDEDTTSEVQENIGKMDFKVQYEEGYNLVFQGRNEEGLEKLLPLEEDHSDWWNLLFMIGLAYKNMNEIETAKRYFEKILVIKPHQVDTMVELGLCEASTFNMEKAIEHFETAAKIKEDPEILCNLGMAYLNNGDLDDAVYYIERAYELDPQDEITIACLRELDKYR